jgi:hypothetical protein
MHHQITVLRVQFSCGQMGKRGSHRSIGRIRANTVANGMTMVANTVPDSAVPARRRHTVVTKVTLHAPKASRTNKGPIRVQCSRRKRDRVLVPRVRVGLGTPGRRCRCHGMDRVRHNSRRIVQSDDVRRKLVAGSAIDDRARLGHRRPRRRVDQLPRPLCSAMYCVDATGCICTAPGTNSWQWSTIIARTAAPHRCRRVERSRATSRSPSTALGWNSARWPTGKRRRFPVRGRRTVAAPPVSRPTAITTDG